MLKRRILFWLLTVSFLLTLFLPWPHALISGLLLCVLGPLRCMREVRREWDHPDWLYEPEDADILRMKGICVDPALLIGDRRMTAEIWLPFEAVTAERFRSKSGAMALSAAIALTDDCAAQQEGTPFSTPEEVVRWERALGIVPENFKVRNPRLDQASYRGYRGAVVQDGEAERAYFVGDVGIHQMCSLILDGTQRQMTAEDRELLVRTVPAESLCYVTGSVEEGRLTHLCYLGAVLPRQRCLPSREAIESGMALNERGLGIMLNGDTGLTLQLVQGMGIEWPEDDGDPGYIGLIPRHETEAEQPRNFVEAVESLQQYALRERNRNLTAVMLGLVLWCCATLCVSRWPLLIGVGCLCGAILLSGRVEIPVPAGRSLQPYLFGLLPGLLIPLVMGVFLPQLRDTDKPTVGAAMLLAVACAFALWIPWTARREVVPARRRLRHFPWEKWNTFMSKGSRLLLMEAVPMALGWLTWLLVRRSITMGDPIPLFFGLVAGLLCAVAVLLVWRQTKN